MTLSRRAATFLVGVAVWNVLTYSIFIKNLYWPRADEPDRPAGFYIAHTVLIIVNFVIAFVLLPIGWRALAAHRARSAAPAATPAADAHR